MLDREALDTFVASLERCQANPMFMAQFYTDFMDASPRIREKFKGTDFRRQYRVLKGSLYMLALAAEGDKPAGFYLDEIVRRHDRNNLDIAPDLYEIWRNVMLQTVREIDPQGLNSDVVDAWQKILQYGIDYLISKHNV
jgi:hemoglobin-like flavoprotein